MNTLKETLNYTFYLNDSISFSVKTILFTLVILFLANIFLKTVKKIATRKLPEEDKYKFATIFTYLKYLTYLILLLVILNYNGVKVTAIITSAAALLLGVGLALQTFFQDVISGIFILFDQSLHVDDIIEIEGKVGKVTKISLRTTKAVTIENKVLVIPNHLYLTNTLYNYTQNGNVTREFIYVGVAYGSDVQLVKSLLIKAANTTKGILKKPEPKVFFDEFGDSALQFKLVFSIKDSFQVIEPKSDLHFEIDRLFREHAITIPFPQRDVRVYKS
ncbi:mechanosensitive ion channel [Lutibacter sp. TH_r2]|uniref:mechanosensitive ion channel family protein n=1 Tax=Lutibacter sp. TH_r2 TaxID=3082083 RepID=UPI0029552D02|nr:mechanosensitive ion channel domain-containing protein [Lutibacter sp. TH_r2]MDV7188549.1 mechanosensitive ion channel [Lutibacter sp. TH_r2]